MNWFISAYARRRIIWLKQGARLNADGARRIRRMTWQVALIIPLCFYLPFDTSNTNPVNFVGIIGVGLSILFVTMPAHFTMLKGYKHRNEIDTSDLEKLESDAKISPALVIFIATVSLVIAIVSNILWP